MAHCELWSICLDKCIESDYRMSIQAHHSGLWQIIPLYCTATQWHSKRSAMFAQNIKEKLFYQLNIKWYELLCSQVVFIIIERDSDATCPWNLDKTQIKGTSTLTMKYNCWKVWWSADPKDLFNVGMPIQIITWLLLDRHGKLNFILIQASTTSLNC